MHSNSLIQFENMLLINKNSHLKCEIQME